MRSRVPDGGPGSQGHRGAGWIWRMACPTSRNLAPELYQEQQDRPTGCQECMPLRNFTFAAFTRPGLLDNHPLSVVHPTAYGEIHNYPMVRRYNERCPVAEKDRF